MPRTISLQCLPVLLAAASLLHATPVGALPPSCVTGGLDTYIALGSAGCMADASAEVRDFSLTLISGSIAANSITVTPSSGAYFFQLSFSSPNFSASAGQLLKFAITYNTDPRPILFDFEDIMDVSSPVAPGSAAVSTDVCIGGTFSPSCSTSTATISTLHNGTPVKLVDFVMFPSTGLLGAKNTFTFDGGPANGGGSSNIQDLRNVVFENPEPGTWWLIGAGLAALAAKRKFRGA